MKAAEFDKIFDDGEKDIIEFLDLSKIRRPGLEKNQSLGQHLPTMPKISEANLL